MIGQLSLVGFDWPTFLRNDDISIFCNHDVTHPDFEEGLTLSLNQDCFSYKMVRLYSINVFYKGAKPVQKKASYELSSFGFFQRSRYQKYWLQ